jgi:nucleoside-diphosphate-sugar epimerase
MAPGTDPRVNAPSLLLTGASSQIGVFAIPRLVKAGFRILAVSRKGKPQAYPDFEQVEWVNEASAVIAAEKCQYFLSAGPIDLAARFLSSNTGFRAAVVFSSSSVETKVRSADRVESGQIQEMLKHESDLQFTAKKTGIKLLILRPTLIYGCGLDTNVSRLANWILRFGVLPVNGTAKGLRQPVHADDLASVAISALLSTEKLPEVLSLAGGSTLTYSDMVDRIFTAVDKTPRVLHLPEWVFVGLIRFVSILKNTGGVNAEMVRRQQIDLIFDNRPAKELLNYHPRPFEPNANDFSLPSF